MQGYIPWHWPCGRQLTCSHVDPGGVGMETWVAYAGVWGPGGTGTPITSWCLVEQTSVQAAGVPSCSRSGLESWNTQGGHPVLEGVNTMCAVCVFVWWLQDNWLPRQGSHKVSRYPPKKDGSLQQLHSLVHTTCQPQVSLLVLWSKPFKTYRSALTINTHRYPCIIVACM